MGESPILVKINFCGQIRAIIHALHARPILVKKIINYFHAALLQYNRKFMNTYLDKVFKPFHATDLF